MPDIGPREKKKHITSYYNDILVASIHSCRQQPIYCIVCIRVCLIPYIWFLIRIPDFGKCNPYGTAKGGERFAKGWVPGNIYLAQPPIYFHNYREQKKTDPSILELFFSRFLGVLETPNQWILEVAMTPISNFQVLITVNSVPESQIIQPYVGMSQEVMVNVPQQVAFEDEAQLVVDSLNLFIYIYILYIYSIIFTWCCSLLISKISECKTMNETATRFLTNIS